MTTTVQPVDMLNEVVSTVRRLDEAKVDIIGNTKAIEVTSHVIDPATSDNMDDADRLLATLRTPDGPVNLRILTNAHGDLADRTGIPKKYYDRMLHGQPDLLAANLNTWLHEEPQTRLIRCITGRNEDEKTALDAAGAMGSMRAMLSDRYRPIDNIGIVNSILPALDRMDEAARVSQFSLTDTLFHLRIVNRDAKTLEMLREQYGYASNPHKFVNEAIAFGVSIRNSETGNAAFSVAPFFEIVRCINGYVTVERLRVAHLGGRTEAEEEFMAAETKRLDDAALFMKAADRLVASFADAQIRASTEKILVAQDETMEIPAEIPMMNFVTGVGRTFDFTEAETEILRDEFVRELPKSGSDGVPSKWTLAQALTATGRRLSDGGDDKFDRREEIEEIGFKVLGDPVTKLIDKIRAKADKALTN